MHLNVILLWCVLLVIFYEESETKVMEPLDPNIIKDFGYVKYKTSNTKLVNGAINSANAEESIRDLLLYRMVMAAIRLAKTKNATVYNGNLRIYGEGVEHKFPPFLERILQRIQTYFSVYKYTDTSQPWNPVNLTTTTINYSATGTTTTISTTIAINPIANNLINLKSTTVKLNGTSIETTTEPTTGKQQENSTKSMQN